MLIIHRLYCSDPFLQWTSYLMPTWKQSITWYCLAVELLSQPAATGNTHYVHHYNFLPCSFSSTGINKAHLLFSLQGIVAVYKGHARMKRQSCTPGLVMLRPLFYLKVGWPFSREHYLQLCWRRPSLIVFKTQSLQQHWQESPTSDLHIRLVRGVRPPKYCLLNSLLRQLMTNECSDNHFISSDCIKHM